VFFFQSWFLLLKSDYNNKGLEIAQCADVKDSS